MSVLRAYSAKLYPLSEGISVLRAYFANSEVLAYWLSEGMSVLGAYVVKSEVLAYWLSEGMTF